MFDFHWTRERLKLFRNVLVCVALASTVCLVVYRIYSSDDFAHAYEVAEPFLKFVGFVVGPLFAIIGYFTTRLDKIEIGEEKEATGRAKERADEAKLAAEAAKEDAERRARYAEGLKRDLELVTKGADQLWKLRSPREFAQFRRWYDGPGARLVSIGNLKGGVGKTTICTNFAAYLSEYLHKSVLIVDLDYQGSLSNMALRAVGRDDITTSRIDTLFAAGANLETLQDARVQLVPRVAGVDMAISQGWLVPSGSTFAQLENQLLFDWLLNDTTSIDVRYRLAHLLLNPIVRREYDVILFDLPPRMTLGSINAIVASQSFFVPTILDGLSIAGVPQLLAQVHELKRDLELKIALSGVIGTLTLRDQLTAKERLRADEIQGRVEAVWPEAHTGPPVFLPQSLPRRVAFSDSAGDDIAYLRDRAHPAGETPIYAIMEDLFKDMADRIGLN